MCCYVNDQIDHSPEGRHEAVPIRGVYPSPTRRYDTYPIHGLRFDSETIRLTYRTIRYDSIRCNFDTISILWNFIRYDTIRYDTMQYGVI